MAIISVQDLVPFADIESAKAQQMIDDAIALAMLSAPCLGTSELTAGQEAAARAVLRAAILRWNDAGSGALQSERLEDYQYTTDTRYPASRGLFFPSEITQLQLICGGTGGGRAFSIDQVPVPTGPVLRDRPDLWFQWVQPVPPDAP